ncbi:hypothetical protein [Glutamicibacter ardleyensis]|uniref:hypothetical protein n=1 Tax=Glutamicibacter ardleyensis TaxID=225894 RepID=UPI003FD65366
MANLPGNPRETPGNEQENLTHAVLALAYEQRTANLIAYYADEDLVRQADSKKIRSMTSDIRTRLGISKTNADS